MALLIKFPDPDERWYHCDTCGHLVGAVMETATNSNQFVCANCLPPELKQYDQFLRRTDLAAVEE